VIDWVQEDLSDGRRRVTATVAHYRVEITFNVNKPGSLKSIQFQQGDLIWRTSQTSMRLDEIQRRAETWLRGGPCRL
jgi:hypothetical protein